MVIPFTNSTDYCCWLNANCDKCEKYYTQNDNGFSTCEIDNAISLSAGGIPLPETMANRMGGVLSTESGEWNFFTNQCTEFKELKRWYITGANENGKALVLGPYNSEELARLDFVKIDDVITCLRARDVRINLENLTLTIEQLPTAIEGQLTVVMQKYNVS